jgi:hypothetical protein
MEWIALISISTMCACFIILCKKEIEITKLEEENRELKYNITNLKNNIGAYADYTYYYKNLWQQEKGKNKTTKQIPKGTIQAVKDAMVRSHPDNGGNQEDFIMYCRAYNILTGKEKI